jgi:hypothetical protein
MKKVMRQVGSDTPRNIIDLSPKVEEAKVEETKVEEVKVEEVKVEEPAAEEPVAEEAKVEETEAQPIAEAVVVKEHTHDENCEHAAEEQAPKRSRKKQAEPSDAE